MKRGKEREEKDKDKTKEYQVKRRYCRTKHEATHTSINPRIIIFKTEAATLTQQQIREVKLKQLNPSQ